MRILFVTRPIGRPWNEGSKNLAFGLANHLRGHEVHLLSAGGLGKLPGHIVVEKIFRAEPPTLEIPFMQKIKIFARLLKNDGADVYHFFFKPNALNAIAMRLLLRLKPKKPVTVQTAVFTLASGKSLKKNIFADHCIVLSRFMQRRLLAAGVKSVARIPPGIDLRKFRPAKSAPAKRRLGFARRQVVLFAGTFQPGGGAEELFLAAKKVIAELPGTLFVFACRQMSGTAAEKEIRERIKSESRRLGGGNFVFLGIVDDMPLLYAAADVCVFAPAAITSKFDYPLFVLEAMACAKPVVVSDTAPLGEIFSPAAGVKVKKGSSSALCSAIVSLLSDCGRAAAVGASARVFAEKNFGIEKCARKHEEFYKKILGNKSG